jgi:hypothetical protein
MADVIAAVDSATGAFGPLVQNRLHADMQTAINDGVTTAVQNMPDVVTAVTNALAPLTADTAVNGLITGTSATQASIDSRVRIRRGFVTPFEYGAVGNGTTDDTAAVQAAVNTGRPVMLAGRFATTDITVTNGNSILGYGPNVSRLIALPGTGTLLTVKNTSSLTLEGFWANGGSNCATVINTDWTTSQGPSLNNSYRNLRVTGGTTQSWSADSNNDCEWHAVLIEPINFGTALNIPAGGGAVHFTDCQFFGGITGAWQVATITGCMLMGITVIGLDYNKIVGTGGYWYASTTNSCNIYISAGSQLYDAPVLTGVYSENANPKGPFIGGPGKLFGATHFDGCKFLKKGNDTQTRPIIGTDVVPASPAPHVFIDYGFSEGVTMTSGTAGVTIHTRYVNVNGTYSNIA